MAMLRERRLRSCSGVSVTRFESVIVSTSMREIGQDTRQAILDNEHSKQREKIQDREEKQLHGSIVERIGYETMSHYVLPFEMVSILLLAALIGAAFLARFDRLDHDNNKS